MENTVDTTRLSAVQHSTTNGRDRAAQTAVELLSNANCYGRRTSRVEHIETHISHVFLTDRFAYKLKKPVKFDFLDFSTSALRRAACEREVQLNRRLAPETYLGVVPICRDRRGHLNLDGKGVPVDWVVKMRRLPADRAVDQLLVAHGVSDRDVQQLATRLTDFYRDLPPLSIRTEEYRQTFENHVHGNHAELSSPDHGLDRVLVDRIHHAQLRLLRLWPELLESRVCDGRIVDGHGDLRPEHIYLAPEPIIIDCIEFNDEFRQIDVLDELGFLAMECDRLGAASVGERIIAAYLKASCDQPPEELLAFYKCYRACVRAKVVALREQQCENGERQVQRQEAHEYLQLADSYASALGPPLLLVVYGLSGTGKSTLAERIAELLDTTLLQTDVIRRELFSLGEEPAGYNEQQYSEAKRVQVYKEMFRQADRQLACGQSVILDGTFLSADLRKEALALARCHGAEPLLIRCECSDAVARERIACRLETGASVSQARPDFLESQRRAFDSDAGVFPVLKVDTDRGLSAAVETVFQRLGQTAKPKLASKQK